MSLIPAAVAAQRHAKEWEEAIRLVGQLCEQTGIATSEYASAMIQGVHDYGPYMVLAPGVAMPHAKTAAGVNSTGVVVVTLDEGVEFGSPANDPVDVLISFAAADKHEHMENIQALAGVLGDQDFMTKIRAAENDDQLAALFKH